jgi:putative NADH-flavin reductase
MKLFVLGATGRTGVELLDLALPGHEVTAFVRSPDKIVRRDPQLSVVTGSVQEHQQVAAAMAGHDAVISALGPHPREAVFGTTLMQESAASTLKAMKAAGVRRLLVVSSALLFPGGGPLVAFFRTLIGQHVRDSQRMEELIAQTDLDWTIARPPRLVLGSEERYVAEDGRFPAGLSVRAAMSWRAVAAFMLHAAEGHLHSRQVVGLVSRAA